MRILLMFLLACFILGCTSNPKMVSYREQIQPILNERCVNCHGTALASARIDVSSFEALMASRTVSGKKPLVVPERPAESWLYILAATDQPHFRMPPDSAKLTPTPKHELEMLARWITQGAKNN